MQAHVARRKSSNTHRRDRYSSVKEFAEAFEQACRDSSQKESREQRGLAKQLWGLMRRGGGSAERREVREQEQVAPMERVPRGEGTSSQADGGEGSAERSRLPRFGEGDRVLRGEGTSSPPTVAEQRLRELWDAAHDAKLLNENWLNGDDKYKLQSLGKHKLTKISPDYWKLGGSISGLWLLSLEEKVEFRHPHPYEIKFKDLASCILILNTRSGKEWRCANGMDEVMQEICTKNLIVERANRFINTIQGQEWLNSEDGQRFIILREHGLTVHCDWEWRWE